MQDILLKRKTMYVLWLVLVLFFVEPAAKLFFDVCIVHANKQTNADE